MDGAQARLLVHRVECVRWPVRKHIRLHNAAHHTRRLKRRHRARAGRRHQIDALHIESPSRQFNDIPSAATPWHRNAAGLQCAGVKPRQQLRSRTTAIPRRVTRFKSPLPERRVGSGHAQLSSMNFMPGRSSLANSSAAICNAFSVRAQAALVPSVSLWL